MGFQWVLPWKISIDVSFKFPWKKANGFAGNNRQAALLHFHESWVEAVDKLAVQQLPGSSASVPIEAALTEV